MDTEGWTSCEEVKKMFNDGFEIAAHTISHEKVGRGGR